MTEVVLAFDIGTSSARCSTFAVGPSKLLGTTRVETPMLEDDGVGDAAKGESDDLCCTPAMILQHAKRSMLCTHAHLLK